MCLTGYYRSHIQNYADKTRIFWELLASKSFWWLDTHSAAFARLKQLITNNVVLAHPVHGKPFLLECNTSDWGIGYIFSQSAGGRTRKVIGFRSRALSKTEQNYSATECECLAILVGIQKYHVYLHGHCFTTVTDHKALTWLMTARQLNPRLIHWAIKLQGYDFAIQH